MRKNRRDTPRKEMLIVNDFGSERKFIILTSLRDSSNDAD